MKTISLSAVGDIMPGDHYFSLGHGIGYRSRRTGFKSLFSDEIRKIFGDADIVFGNLEGVISELTDKTIDFERDVFRGTKGVARDLAALGFNVINVANNHALQHGEQAFWETVEQLTNSNIHVLGLQSPEGSSHCLPVNLAVDGIEIGLLGYSAVNENHSAHNRCYAMYATDSVAKDIDNLRRCSDIVIVSVHSGSEGTEYIDNQTRSIVHDLTAREIDVILIHHSHVFQPVRRIQKSLVAFNLGDFVFDLLWDKRLHTSAILNVQISEEGDTNHNLVPVIFDKEYQVVLANPAQKCRFLKHHDTLASLTETDMIQCNTQESRIWNTVDSTWLETKKYLYFFLNFFKGNTALKWNFLANKLKKLVT